MSRYLPKRKFIQTLILFSVISTIFAQNPEESTKINDSIKSLTNSVVEYIQINDFLSAFDYATKAVELTELTEDKNVKAQSYIAIGNAYQALKKLELAEDYFNKGLLLGKELNNLEVTQRGYSGLSYISAILHNDPDKSIDYQNKALQISEALNNPVKELVTLMNLIGLNLRYKRLNQAEIELTRLDDLYRNYESLIALGKADYEPSYHAKYEDLHAKYYRQKKDYAKALVYLKKAETIAYDNCLYTNIININKGFYNIYEQQNKIALANERLLEILEYTDLLNDIKNNKEVEILTAKFKVNDYKRQLAASEKEKEILEALSLSKSKTIAFTTISIGMLLILLGSMYYGYKKRKANYELQIHNESLEEAKNNAERLTKLKSKFISRVSHELRTPLYGVIGITSMLEEDTYLTKKHTKLINALKFSGDHLINLVNSVLKISEIESQNIQLNKTHVNLNILLTNIVNSFQFQAQQNKNKLSLFIAEEVMEIYKFDALRLSEIVINLIENAIQFTRDGEILVSVTLKERIKNKDRLLFKVKDNGKGISEDQRLAVFDNFNQASDEENTYDGAGLGLSIVKHLLELMNSEIKLTSGINQGSTFSFELVLPIGETKKTLTNTNETPEPKRILIVEDHKISQMVTCNLIELIGHSCTIAENGAEALKIIKKETFDLVLMDLNMPVMNGYDATQEIKLLEPKLKIIALTATEITEVKEKCLDYGMVDVINKPLSKSGLDYVLNKFI